MAQPKYKKVPSTHFYAAHNYQHISARLQAIGPDAQRQWGRMTVTQMLRHLNLAIGGGLGYYNLPDKSNVLTRTVVKYLLLHRLQRFPKGATTPRPLVVTDDGLDFDREKQQLQAILDKAFGTKMDTEWGHHPYFGKMKRADWGKLIMIHCNHHFQQFGY
jgi:hypothetical protein